MIHISVLLLGTLIAVSSENKTDLAEYPDLVGGDNITELLSLNTEDTEHEEVPGEDLENDAPIDAGRRKGK